jgi:hypothetical protein
MLFVIGKGSFAYELKPGELHKPGCLKNQKELIN